MGQKDGSKMGSTAHWYETGYEGAEREAERQSFGQPPDRLWQPGGNTKEVVFVDDAPFCIREHQWRDSNGRWHWATCIAKISEQGCPACEKKPIGHAAYVGYYTLVDVSGYVTRDGEENKYRMILCPAKTKVLNKFKQKKENRGTLTGQLWNLSRADSNTASTGDDLDHVREINLKGLFDVATFKGKPLAEMISKANAPGPEGLRVRKYLSHFFRLPDEGEIPAQLPVFNYPSILAPMESADIRAAAADVQPYGAKTGGGGASSGSDDIPF